MPYELGHAVYSSKNIPSAVPRVAHRSTSWLEGQRCLTRGEQRGLVIENGVNVPDPKGLMMPAPVAHAFGFSRWCQVMWFEKMTQPGPELTVLWWDSEKVNVNVRVTRRITSKIHVVSAPAYYQHKPRCSLRIHHAIAVSSKVISDKSGYVGRRIGELRRTGLRTWQNEVLE
jgi:hypothetical protein